MRSDTSAVPLMEYLHMRTECVYDMHVSCRDFVTLRHWKVSEDQEVILSSGVAVTHPAMPPCSQHVRSVNIHKLMCYIVVC